MQQTFPIRSHLYFLVCVVVVGCVKRAERPLLQRAVWGKDPATHREERGVSGGLSWGIVWEKWNLLSSILLIASQYLNPTLNIQRDWNKKKETEAVLFSSSTSCLQAQITFHWEKCMCPPPSFQLAGEATWSEATWANQRLICQFLAVNWDAETSCSSRRPHFSLPAASSECQYIFIHLSSTSALLSAPECHLHSLSLIWIEQRQQKQQFKCLRESRRQRLWWKCSHKKKSFLTHRMRCLDVCRGGGRETSRRQ